MCGTSSSARPGSGPATTKRKWTRSSTRSRLSSIGSSRRTRSSGPSSPRSCGAVRWADRPGAEPMPVMKPAEDNMDTAARVLALAQQTADQAIAVARREADETLNRARREADDLLTKARRQSEQITADARARAEALERDAQERHRQAMGSLVQSREELERRVGDLRAFEREYRSRLKAYLESQLRDLEAGTADSGVFPAVSATGPQPAVGVGAARMDMRNGGPAPSAAGSFGVMPETVGHNGGGYHPIDSGQHDRR